MERRQHDRLTHPGRRQSDRRIATSDHRRVLLVGPDEAWRLATTYGFEEAGYVVYAAANPEHTVAIATRRLPDVVVIKMATDDALAVIAALATGEMPVVVLTASLQSPTAVRVRAAGGIPLLRHAVAGEIVIGEVDTLIEAGPHAQRRLTRRLLDLQDVVQHYRRDGTGPARLRHLIDHLQGALVAINERGCCIAASEGATMMTGYSHHELLTSSVWDSTVAPGGLSDAQWQDFLTSGHFRGTTTITTRAGEDVRLHAVAAAILPDVHVAAFALM
jgi:PAS domain S-box-containing protein